MAQLEKELHTELKNCEVQFQEKFVEQVTTFRESVLGITDRDEEQPPNSGIGLKLRHLVSIPFIYFMIIPLAFLDLTISIYQMVCFRLYNIPQVKRSEHFIIDRQLLSNLNGIQKFNCIYCGYGNGVVSYAREILSRTEQYWCPIKHAKNIHSASARYRAFLEYGDTENYSDKISEYRRKLRGDD
jgi:hypothetical protein